MYCVLGRASSCAAACGHVRSSEVVRGRVGRVQLCRLFRIMCSIIIICGRVQSCVTLTACFGLCLDLFGCGRVQSCAVVCGHLCGHLRSCVKVLGMRSRSTKLVSSAGVSPSKTYSAAFSGVNSIRSHSPPLSISRICLMLQAFLNFSSCDHASSLTASALSLSFRSLTLSSSTAIPNN